MEVGQNMDNKTCCCG